MNVYTTGSVVVVATLKVVVVAVVVACSNLTALEQAVKVVFVALATAVVKRGALALEGLVVPAKKLCTTGADLFRQVTHADKI